MLTLFVSGVAVAQNTLNVGGQEVRLGEAKGVAVGVETALWEATGKAILFAGRDADGMFQGVFRTDTMKGKEVLRLPPNTTIVSRVWLAQRPVVLEVLSQSIPERKAKRWSVTVIDADTFSANELWTWEYPEQEPVGVEVNPSPSLDHALITVNDSKGSHPYVLCDGANSQVRSTEIEAAQKAGHRFAGWSADGSAYFGPASAQPGPQEFVIEGGQGQGENGTVLLNLTLAKIATRAGAEVVTLDGLSGKLTFTAAQPTAPPAGTAVLEVMPWNGRIRSVRSKGPFVKKPIPSTPVTIRPEPARVVSGLRQGPARALWLLPESVKPEDPIQPASLLIAPEADGFWISGDRSWLAYRMAGALFVRKIITQR